MKIHQRLAEMALLGATENGIDRGLFSAADYAARRRFADWAAAAGCTIEQDRVGNVFGKIGGDSHAAPIMCGSHLDTVKNGGAYDGAYGVLGGLEALERIAASGVALRRPLEVVAWAGEEGSRFPLGCLGSSVYAGLTPYDDVVSLVADDGETFNEARHGPHGLLAGVPVRGGFPVPAAYVELHIEQGPVLELTGTRLGIVTAVAGQRRLRVEVTGRAGHAGTIPMSNRADALCAASEIVLAVEAAALDIGEAVATVGRLEVVPNQTNIVPGAVALRVDARSVDDARIVEIERRLRVAARTIARTRVVQVTVELIEERKAAAMHFGLRALARTICEQLMCDPLDLPSGAGHDAMCLASIVPTAMLFVPSVGGHSHVAAEMTDRADLELGIEALGALLLAANRDQSLAH